MKLKVITTCDNVQNPGYLKLKASLERFGYDHEVIEHPFSFGHQLPVIRDWCHRYTGEATHMLYTDAWDTLALSGPGEIDVKLLELGSPKMLISAEKNCYPHPARATDYPETNTPWKYVNGGGWLVDIEYFKHLCDKERLSWDSHDQVWLMEVYLRNQGEIKLDTQCEIFQTIAFSNVEEWEKVGERLRNVGTGTQPIFWHGNGRTPLDFVYDVLNV